MGKVDGWLFRVVGEDNPWNYTREKFNNAAYEFVPIQIVTQPQIEPRPFNPRQEADEVREMEERRSGGGE
jgi:hypothetical protein